MPGNSNRWRGPRMYVLFSDAWAPETTRVRNWTSDGGGGGGGSGAGGGVGLAGAGLAVAGLLVAGLAGAGLGLGWAVWAEAAATENNATTNTRSGSETMTTLLTLCAPNSSQPGQSRRRKAGPDDRDTCENREWKKGVRPGAPSFVSCFH
jgi:hypothetical protein